jgi:hypothetical protein
LEKRISPQNRRHLAATVHVLRTKTDDRSHFENEALAFLVKAFVASGDRKSLVRLLSKRCENRIDGPELIEFWLTFHGQKLKDPILVLGEAYARCDVPETRHLLAAAVRRGFADFGIHGADDAEYVGNAMRWYENNKKDLDVNYRYTLNETGNGASFTMDTYELHPEFYDNPPGARDPLFQRSTGHSRTNGFVWLLLSLAAAVVGVEVALFILRAKRRRARTKLAPARL